MTTYNGPPRRFSGVLLPLKEKFVRNALTFLDIKRFPRAAGVSCDSAKDPTVQSAKEECDINTIVRRFGLTGQLPENLQMPVSGNFWDVTDFQSAMNVVRKAQEEFMSVPADIRARFNNDPGRFIAFLEDVANEPEARKLGLLKPKPEVTRDVVTAVDELAARFPQPAKPAANL